MMDVIRVGIRLAFGLAVFALVVALLALIPVPGNGVDAIGSALGLPIAVLQHWIPGFSTVFAFVAVAFAIEFAILDYKIGKFAYDLFMRVWL